MQFISCQIIFGHISKVKIQYSSNGVNLHSKMSAAFEFDKPYFSVHFLLKCCVKNENCLLYASLTLYITVIVYLMLCYTEVCHLNVVLQA